MHVMMLTNLVHLPDLRRCMSPACYGWQYGLDALEEGEDDSTRGPRFCACVLREIREARAAAAGLPPQPLRAAGYRRRPQLDQ